MSSPPAAAVTWVLIGLIKIKTIIGDFFTVTNMSLDHDHHKHVTSGRVCIHKRQGANTLRCVCFSLCVGCAEDTESGQRLPTKQKQSRIQHEALDKIVVLWFGTYYIGSTDNAARAVKRAFKNAARLSTAVVIIGGCRCCAQKTVVYQMKIIQAPAIILLSGASSRSSLRSVCVGWFETWWGV